MTRIKAVLFDMFDTLMLIEKDHAFYSPSLHGSYEFLVANGVSVTFEEFEKTYVSVRDAIFAEVNGELGEPHFNLRIAGTLKKLGYECDVSSPLVTGATDAFCERFMTFARIDENAESVLRELRKRYELGVVSNFAIPECVYELLERHGLEKFFDAVIVSGAVNRRKPHQEIFKKALQELGVTAEETVFVGDTVDADVLGPKAAGMRTIYLERRLQKDSEIACPTQTIRSLNQLQSALERC